MILERYFSAIESIAFPLPQGFSAFFAYLGYHALDFKTFIQYVDHNVFELQFDVLNGIFKGSYIEIIRQFLNKLIDLVNNTFKLFIIAIGSDSPKAAERKHLILSKVPRSRSYRILKNLNDSRTLRVLGRDHANAILSGANSANSRKNSKAMSIGKIRHNIHFHLNSLLTVSFHSISKSHSFLVFK